MSSPDEIKKHRDLNNAFLTGERILGIKFRHNSLVAFIGASGDRCEGWVVSVGPIEPEPVYTVECRGARGNEEVLESKLTLILDSHENPTA
jgi:hypothetical protein